VPLQFSENLKGWVGGRGVWGGGGGWLVIGISYTLA